MIAQAPFRLHRFHGGLHLDDRKALSTGTPIAEVPLVALEAVDQAGIFGRAWDAIRLWIK